MIAPEKIVYLSGPMGGYPEWNRAAFNTYADAWRARGYAVFNPAEQGFDAPPEQHYVAYLPQDIRDVLLCNTVAVLPGWYRSRGALLEVMLAKLLGKTIVHVEDGTPLYDFSVGFSDFTLQIQPT